MRHGPLPSLERGSGRSTGLLGAIGLVLAVLLVPTPSWTHPASARATTSPDGVETVPLATRHLDAAPRDRRWVLRRGHPLNEDAHAHAGGFVYAASGQSFLVVDDTQGVLMPEGSARWAPEGIGHLHTTPFRASSSGRAADGGTEIWTISLERESDLRQPGAAAISPPLQGFVAGPYEARLAVATFQPGASTPLRRRTGPELAYTLDGAWELEYAGVPFALGAAQGYLADPGVPHRLRNVGSEPARLLSAQLVPDGRPAEEPAPSP